jgi:hypothetical protein
MAFGDIQDSDTQRDSNVMEPKGFDAGKRLAGLPEGFADSEQAQELTQGKT